MKAHSEELIFIDGKKKSFLCLFMLLLIVILLCLPKDSLAAKTTGEWGNVKWEFENGVTTFTSGGTLGLSEAAPWYSNDKIKGPIDGSEVRKIRFTEKVYAPSNSSSLFIANSKNANKRYKNLQNLEEIDGIELLDTSDVENFSYMFGFTKLKKIDLSGWTTRKAIKMHNMFNNFNDTSVLEELDISGFDMARVEDYEYFFTDQKKLKKLTLGKNFKVGGSGKNQRLRLPNIQKTDEYTGKWIHEKSGKVVGTSDEFMENYDGSLPGTYVWEKKMSEKPKEPEITEEKKVWGNVPWDFDSQTGTLTFLEGGKFTGYTDSPWNTKKDYKINPQDIKEIVFKEKVVAPDNSAYLFSTYNPSDPSQYLSNLEKITNLDLLETAQVFSMSDMFRGASSLKSLNLRAWKTENVGNMYAMFSEMTSLEELDISNFYVTDKTNTLHGMFYDTNIKRITLGKNFNFFICQIKLDKISLST